MAALPPSNPQLLCILQIACHFERKREISQLIVTQVAIIKNIKAPDTFYTFAAHTAGKASSMKKYKHLFFDLDRTLWDFEKSAKETFSEIYKNFNLKEKDIDTEDDFVREYQKNNDMLWSHYRKGEIRKEVLSVRRFDLTLKDFGIDDQPLAGKIAEYYITESPRKINLFPHALEILQYLMPKYYLHIITNGFEEVQQTKLRVSGLRKYFLNLITSEMAGVKKPEEGIFLYAFDITDAAPSNSLMIGDDLEVDIRGARNIGMDQMFANHNKVEHSEEITMEVNSLREIEHIL